MAQAVSKFLILTLVLAAGFHAAALDHFGAGVHLIFGEGEPKSVFDLMRQTGFDSVRDEFNWEAVESPRGTFKMPDFYMLYLNEAYRNQLTPLVLLAYGHSGYDNNGYPRSPEALAAYGQYAATVAGALPADKPKLIQVWNEWDGGTGMRSELAGTGDVPSYLELLKKTVPEIKKKAADTIVIGNSYTKAQNFEAAIEAGLLNECDVPAIHTYNYFHGAKANAENWEGFFTSAILPTVRRSSKPDTPIYITEMGYPTSLGKKGREYQDAAAQLVRVWLLAQKNRQIKGLYIYNLVNTGYDSWNDENNFGLTEVDLTAKDALYAIRGLLDELKGARYDGEVQTGLSGITVLKFIRPDGSRSLVLWSSYFDDQWRVTLSLKSAVPVSITRPGYPSYPADCGRTLELTLSAMPLIVTGNNLAPDKLSVIRIPRPTVNHDSSETMKMLPHTLTAARETSAKPVYRKVPTQEVWRGDKGWHGEQDFNGEMSIRWSPQFLTFEFRVTDDCLQKGEAADRITLLLNHSASGSDPGNRLEFELRFGPVPQYKLLYSGAPSAANPVIKGKLENKNTWWCSIKIPAQLLGVDKLQPGDLLESKIKIMDYDGPRADKFTILSYGLDTNEFLILEP